MCEVLTNKSMLKDVLKARMWGWKGNFPSFNSEAFCIFQPSLICSLLF